MVSKLSCQFWQRKDDYQILGRPISDCVRLRPKLRIFEGCVGSALFSIENWRQLSPAYSLLPAGWMSRSYAESTY